MLEIKQLHIDFGGFKAINGVDFELKEGEHHAIIGLTVRVKPRSLI